MGGRVCVLGGRVCGKVLLEKSYLNGGKKAFY